MPSQYEDLARSALLEITPAATVGAFARETDEGDGVVSVLFDSAQPGYPDWKWTVSIAHVEGSEPTVVEAELMPGDGAMLAPDWVPWSDRLADYKAAQEALGLEADAAALEIDDAESDDESDDDSEDDDEDDFGSDVLHGGDLDGVDIDDLDSSDDDPDEDEQEKSY